MEKLNLNPKGKYLVQDEAYVGQKLADRIYPYSVVLSAKKDMRPFDPVSQKVVSDLQEVPANTEAIELNGITYYVNPDLHAVLVGIATHIEMIESENRALKDQLKAASAPPELVNDPTPTEETKKISPAPKDESGDAPDKKYKLVEKSAGYFSVVDVETGETVQEKGLRKAAANELIAKLEAGQSKANTPTE